MVNFTDLISNITTFNTQVLIPFIVSFFTTTIGFCFIAVVVLVVVIHLLASLMYKHK